MKLKPYDLKLVPIETRKILLSKWTSIANKLHIITELKTHGYYVDVNFVSCVKPIAFRFNPENNWETAADYLNDVINKYADVKFD